MKHLLSLTLVAGLSFVCITASGQTGDPDVYYMPAEYAQHESVWLGWKDYAPYHQPFIDITQALVDEVPIRMIAVDSTNLSNLKDLLSENGIDTARVEFYIIKDNRLWMRDHGATYVVDGKGNKKVVDFEWTLYGNRAYLRTYFEGNEDSVAYHYRKNLGQTGAVDSLMGAIDGYASVKTGVAMEGGSVEVNGKGTLILCEAVTIQRNPRMTKEHIESAFERTLGVSNILWMKQGLVEDPFMFNQIFGNYFGWGTNGHTDEFVRFANDSTILLAWVDEADKNLNEFNRRNYERMSENLAILEQSRDQEGKPFNVVKVPLPDPVYLETTVTDQPVDWSDRSRWKVPIQWLPRQGMKQAGDSIKLVAAASYLNYLVTNGTVLLPSYVQEGSNPEKEQRVQSIFSELFPHRRLKFLDVMNLNFHGGGIHCVTQQEPTARPRSR